MPELEFFQKVNATDSLSELSDVILQIADENGMIQGRTRKFEAKKMAEYCRDFKNYSPNVLTREYGIRQQALYLSYYNK